MEKYVENLTQEERILKILTDANGQYVDGMTFLKLEHPITQSKARMFGLKQKGHNIESRFIEGKNWKEYRLIPPEK
jgi:hypothetical protein